MLKKRTSYIAIGIVMLIILIMNYGEFRPATEKYRETRVVMGTVVQLDVCQAERRKEKNMAAFKAVWERLGDIGWRMNVYDEKSEISKINTSLSGPVKVGSDTYHVLERSLYYTVATDGAFDITVRPLIELWQYSAYRNILPTHERIIEVKNAVGLNKIELLGKNMVRRTDQKTKVDLGGIAKGYAIDEAARIFREHGVQNFFIDAGGDIYGGGNNCRGEPWRVGIKDPADRSELIEIIGITDAAVTTSGDYERYYTIIGKQWSHIINPKTGYPQHEVVSATVIAPKAIDADALSTALTVMGGAAGTAHINSLNDRYASLIAVKSHKRVNDPIKSNAFERFLINDKTNSE